MVKRKEVKPQKPCQECKVEFAIQGEKFCKSCRKAFFKMLEAEGYLEKAPKSCGTFSEERGRKGASVDLRTLGGSAEMNTDGDDW